MRVWFVARSLDAGISPAVAILVAVKRRRGSSDESFRLSWSGRRRSYAMYSSASSPAAARRELEQSLRLFTDLGDDEGIAEVGSLLRQTDTGLQAETFMSQAQAALELHDYDRAQTLLNVSLVAPQ